MKYVLDSSVALKWVLAETHSDKAIRLREGYRNGTDHLVAPDIFVSEIANGLASAERQKRISTGNSIIFFKDVLRAAPLLRPSTPLLHSLHRNLSRNKTSGLRLHLHCLGGGGRLRVRNRGR